MGQSNSRNERWNLTCISPFQPPLLLCRGGTALLVWDMGRRELPALGLSPDGAGGAVGAAPGTVCVLGVTLCLNPTRNRQPHRFCFVSDLNPKDNPIYLALSHGHGAQQLLSCSWPPVVPHIAPHPHQVGRSRALGLLMEVNPGLGRRLPQPRPILVSVSHPSSAFCLTWGRGWGPKPTPVLPTPTPSHAWAQRRRAHGRRVSHTALFQVNREAASSFCKGRREVLVGRHKSSSGRPPVERSAGGGDVGSPQLWLCGGCAAFARLLAGCRTGILGRGGRRSLLHGLPPRGALCRLRGHTFGEVINASSSLKPWQRSWASNSSSCSLVTSAVRAAGKAV